MSTNEETRPILALGGTGKTGRRVVERLRSRGIGVRVGSRSATPPFDWDDRTTWGPALDGVAAAYVTFQPDLAVPGAVEKVGSFAELAVSSGVPRLVLLSGRGEPEAELAEQAVRDAGTRLTVVRSTWFSQNFSESFFLDLVGGGEVALPAGETQEPFVDAEDIADVAVASLLDDRHVGRTYELTGPSSLGFAEAVGEIAAATGRDIRYVPVPLDAFTSALAGQGVPDEVVTLLAYLFGEVLDGRNAHPADGVEQALGRPPRAFRDYVWRTAATGVWQPARAEAAA